MSVTPTEIDEPTGWEPGREREAPPGRRSAVRLAVLGSACALAVVTYLHRVGFASASSELQASLRLNGRQTGALMAAFMVAYGLFEIPWGRLADRLGVRSVLTAVVLGGSAATALVALAGMLPLGASAIFALVLALRFLFGALQAGTFPAVSRMMADWMPVAERGGAQGLIWMSSRLGGALAPLLIGGLIGLTGGWTRALLVASGLGLLWCAAFRPWFRDRPEDMPRVNDAERAWILSGRAARPAGHGAVPWRAMLESRSAWALCLMYGCLGYSGNFFLTLLPSYLRNQRGLDAQTERLLTTLPFVCGVGACLVGGVLSDAIIGRHGRRWGRRLVGAAGLGLAGLAILATTQVSDVAALGVLLCLTFIGNDLAMGPAWAAAADIGERHAGTLSGAMNMIASFTAAAMAMITGALFDAGRPVVPFVIFAIVYALGALCWLGVDVTRPLADPEAATTSV
jgi:sugar phosphate permease